MLRNAILARANAVRTPGEWIGLFELVVWSWLRGVRVLMLYGKNIVDVRAWFGCDLPRQVLVGTHRLAAVKVTDRGTWLSAPELGSGRTNHFVIGVAAKDRRIVKAPVAGRSLVVTTAKSAALSVGWTLKATVAQGDCGVDCMAYYDNAANRCRKSWLAVRLELAEFMESVHTQAVWQQVYSMCGEADPRPRRLAAPRSVGGMGPPEGSKRLGLGPPPLPPPLLPPSSLPPLSLPPTSSAPPPSWPVPLRSAASTLTIDLEVGSNETSSSQHAFWPKLQPPLVSGRPLAIDCDLDVSAHEAREGGALVARALAGSVGGLGMRGALAANTGEGVQSFGEWVQDMSPDDLNHATQSYFSYRAVEEQWRQQHPVLKNTKLVVPAARHSASKVNFKLATGVAFLRWLASDGKDSKSPLKDRLFSSRGCCLFSLCK
jgi:hypothetical protein